jgi:hypothetical protein
VRYLSLATLAATASAAAFAALPAAPATAARGETPFASISGAWSGTGQVRLDGGRSERMTCRAYYNSRDGGNLLGMAIRCASTSFKIELRSNLHYNGGRVSGTWEERNFNASGQVAGRASDGSMNLAISGAVDGSMSVNFGASHQTVSINTSGTGFSGVSMSLSRG